MACNNQFRHVCLKDLENYIKRDEYFSDFSDEEKAELTELLKSKKEDNAECNGEKCGCESSNDSGEEKQNENND